MATIICSQNQAYFSCDEPTGCNRVSPKYFYEKNVAEIDAKARKDGWYVSMMFDKAYCPTHNPHSYGRD